MRLSIFSRLFAGYAAVILLFGGISAYSVVTLHRLNHEVDLLFNQDERVVDLKDKLVDSLLSQMASARKFVVTGDVSFIEQMADDQKDFKARMDEVSSIVGRRENRELLSIIQMRYGRYSDLVNEEIELIRTNRPYDRNAHRQKTDMAADETIQGLKVLENVYRQDIRERMAGIRDMAVSAGRLSITLFAAALLLVVLGSLMSTRGITRPLEALMEKTREISRGVF